MPTRHRTRLIAPLPIEVTFPSATLVLELVYVRPGFRWELIVRQQGRAGCYLAAGPWITEKTALAELYGLGIAPGDATVAATVLRRLVATGRAERIVDA